MKRLCGNSSSCTDYDHILFVPRDYAQFMFAEFKLSFNWKRSYERIMVTLWIALSLLIHNFTENAEHSK